MTDDSETTDSHVHRNGKTKQIQPKTISRIDYPAFGILLRDWMNDQGHDARYLANRVELSERPHAREGLIESMANGYKTTPEDVQAVASECGLEVPYTDKAPVKKSPFGQGHAGKRGRA